MDWKLQADSKTGVKVEKQATATPTPPPHQPDGRGGGGEWREIWGGGDGFRSSSCSTDIIKIQILYTLCLTIAEPP